MLQDKKKNDSVVNWKYYEIYQRGLIRFILPQDEQHPHFVPVHFPLHLEQSEVLKLVNIKLICSTALTSATSVKWLVSRHKYSF